MNRAIASPPRTAPRPVRAGPGWRDELFGSPWRAALTLLLAAAFAWLAWRFLGWAVWNAVWVRDAQACRAAELHGACWGVVNEKLRPILFGRYPHDAQWRPLLACVLMLSLGLFSAWPRSWRAWLPVVWLGTFGLVFALMRGGVAGLDGVPTTRWGGLPLSLMLALLGLGLAMPLAVVLALGRRSGWPAVRVLCRTLIEAVRGVPLISVLFMASFLLPLLLPGGQVDVLLRVLAGLTLFAAAYLAEVLRGGLQAVPAGQVEAARALGLSAWQVQRSVVLPQAFRAALPALMNSVIGVLKDTSLVTVVGLYELTGALTLALGGDPVWRPFYWEGYLFIAAIYWVLCFGLSRYSRWIEARLRSGPG